MIAALYVETGGVYFGLDGVDPWDEQRDARLYDGPHPVVAHPPCARWSRLAGFTESRYGYKRGDDGGCFAAALDAVRRFGGVLEHPAYSAAWDHFGIAEPTWRGGWTGSICGGWTCYVEQGRYGLPVKKATWLYAYGVEQLPELRWGYSPDATGDSANQDEYGGLHAWARNARREQFTPSRHRGSHYGLASITPPDFRDVLIGMARSAALVTA